jgi:hypothetical protein
MPGCPLAGGFGSPARSSCLIAYLTLPPVTHPLQLSAGRFMSAAVTAAGEVWTFGGGVGGEQRSSGTHGGTHGGGLSSAPRRVEGLLAQVLADNGGAVKVAAGGAFCVALTASGRVVLWGQARGNEAAPGVQPAAAAAAAIASPPLPASQHGRRRRAAARMPVAAAASAAAAEPAASEQQAEQQQAAAAAAAGAGAAVEQEEMPNLRILKQPGMLVAEVVDLPPMTDVAVGYTHITMTDGSSVWTIGRWAWLCTCVCACVLVPLCVSIGCLSRCVWSGQLHMIGGKRSALLLSLPCFASLSRGMCSLAVCPLPIATCVPPPCPLFPLQAHPCHRLRCSRHAVAAAQACDASAGRWHLQPGCRCLFDCCHHWCRGAVPVGHAAD